ncbi:MAG: hypothetical protein HUJ66_07535, partial [Oscillospiraceae bacterium]|nr:hypothetical protein [Oscillospiraceae bacterium]
AGLLGIYDTLSTGVLMPLVTGVMSVALGWLWKPGLAEDECELSGTGFRGRALFSLCCRVVVPLLMLLTVAGQALKIS